MGASRTHLRIAGFAVLATVCAAPMARAAPQLVLRKATPDGSSTVEVLPPGHGVARAYLDGELVHSEVLDPAAPRRVLVEFDAVPEAIARLHGGDPSRARASLDRFRGDLARIVPAVPMTGAATPAWTITHEYTQVFSGAAITVPEASLAALRKLPYVRRVTDDDSVRATVFESVPLVGAQRVRNELGADGTGIRVGILDTGIDYDHAWFGGGFGPGHRVAGGWDFAYGDADPMDDAGHGTHVAGIVAGVAGVAPGATLYAFKVLDAQGNGWESTILAGLERVLDPDLNPATPDAMHVINLSLGGYGSPDGPMSLAVDNLTEAGVVCVVAAGNNYASFTITSPGVARRAITVGASTKGDLIADFSSRGPVHRTLDLKPDLLAPGADILSAARGGGLVALSGTSMATPHVAGVAAQLRQLHPGWTADHVKQVLVGTARDLFMPAFDQGAGRLDAWAAANASFTVSPTHLAFGRTDGQGGTWTRRDTLVVTNLSAASRTVTFPGTLSIAPGATIVVSPDLVVLAPGETAEVIAELQMDQGSTPYPPEIPYGYTGALVASSGEERRRVPVSFHKAASLELRSDSAAIDWWIVHEPTPGGRAYHDFFGEPSVLLPPGTYDVVATFHPYFRFVVKEHVTVTGDAVVDVDSDVHHLLHFDDVGPDGEPVTSNGGVLHFRHETERWSYEYVGFSIPEVACSPMSAGYRLEWNRLVSNLRDLKISLPGARSGVSASEIITNDPGAFRHVAVRVPVAQPSGILLWDFEPMVVFDSEMGWGWFDPELPPVTEPFTYDYWITPSPWEGHIQRGYAIDLYASEAMQVGDLSSPFLLGSMLRVDRGWPFENSFFRFTGTSWGTVGGPMSLFQGMPVWRGRFQNTTNFLFLDAGPELYVPHLVTDMYGTMRLEPDRPYQVFRDGLEIRSDILRGTGGFSTPGPVFVELPEAGLHRFQTNLPFTVRNRSATLHVTATMDTRESDPDPPSLRVLQLLADGVATDSIPRATGVAQLRFRLTDAAVLAAPSLFLRHGSTGGWRPLEVRSENDEFVADIPAIERNPVAVLLVATDPTGNRLDMLWDPAFTAAPGPRSPNGPPPEGPVSLALGGASPNPAFAGDLTVAFSLASSDVARLTIHDVSGRRLYERDVTELGPGPHVLALGGEVALRPGIYFLRLTQSGQVRTRKACILAP